MVALQGVRMGRTAKKKERIKKEVDIKEWGKIHTKKEMCALRSVKDDSMTRGDKASTTHTEKYGM